MLKKLIAIFMCALLAFSLCSCRFLDNDLSALMAPPSPAGELALVKNALDTYAAKGYTLKYPDSGEYLSPFILKDIDGDGVNEAFAIYSTITNSVISMHLAYICNISGEWTVVNDAVLTASAVERVLFSDMDADGISEIIVGWNVFGTAERQVGVYSVTDGTIVQRLLEKYSGFVICDLDQNLTQEIFINYLNTAEKTATARLLSLKDLGIEEVSRCPLDPNITQFSEPVVSTVLSGEPAIYIDAQKGAGMLTEVLVLINGKLQNAFYDPVTTETAATFRPSAVPSRDFNDDNIIDIPVMLALPSSEQLTDADKSYITEWSSLNGTELDPIARTIMNYTDGYYLLLPDVFTTENLTLTRKISSRLRVIYLWDPKDKTILNELFRIQLISETEWDSGEYDRGDLFEITRSTGTVYAASIPVIEGSWNMPRQQLIEMFKLIN